MHRSKLVGAVAGLHFYDQKGLHPVYPQRWGPPDVVHGAMLQIGGVQTCTCGRNLWLRRWSVHRGRERKLIPPPLLHRIHNILQTKFENLKLRLAFVSDHSQSLYQTLNTLQSSQGGLAPFVHDFVLNLEQEYRELTQLDSKFSSPVEERLKRFRVPAPYRAFLGAAAKRAADHLTNVRAKNPEQWRFYKELRILNPANLSTMSHDISLYSTLQLPLPLSVTCGVERDLCAK